MPSSEQQWRLSLRPLYYFPISKTASEALPWNSLLSDMTRRWNRLLSDMTRWWNSLLSDMTRWCPLFHWTSGHNVNVLVYMSKLTISQQVQWARELIQSTFSSVWWERIGRSNSVHGQWILFPHYQVIRHLLDNLRQESGVFFFWRHVYFLGWTPLRDQPPPKPFQCPHPNKRVPICSFLSSASICILIKTWNYNAAELWGKTEIRTPMPIWLTRHP